MASQKSGCIFVFDFIIQLTYKTLFDRMRLLSREALMYRMVYKPIKVSVSSMNMSQVSINSISHLYASEKVIVLNTSPIFSHKLEKSIFT